MEKVREAGVDVMTFGQYMRPTRRHMPVSHYVTPEAFDQWKKVGEEMVRLGACHFECCMFPDCRCRVVVCLSLVSLSSR